MIASCLMSNSTKERVSDDMSRENRNFTIGVIEGDGIGPEIVKEAVKVLDAAAKRFGFTTNYVPMLFDRPVPGSADGGNHHACKEVRRGFDGLHRR